MKRTDAYGWLAERMGFKTRHGQVNKRRCHIGRFSADQCKQVIAICRKEIQ